MANPNTFYASVMKSNNNILYHNVKFNTLGTHDAVYTVQDNIYLSLLKIPRTMNCKSVTSLSLGFTGLARKFNIKLNIGLFNGPMDNLLW